MEMELTREKVVEMELIGENSSINNDNSNPVKTAHELMAQKDAIEAEVAELEQVLRGQGVGMTEPLVDRSGFPRADVNLVAIRTARARIIGEYALRNDHKCIMSQIEQALHAIHAEAQRVNSQRLLDNKQLSQTTTPFAIVNAIAPDSPAKEAGLQKGDKILKFGTIHTGNHEKLQALNALVGQSEGKIIEVTIERDASSSTEQLPPPTRMVLQFTPRRGWGGRGLLGQPTSLIPCDQELSVKQAQYECDYSGVLL
ncbi:514_t:CDS:2 [Ambispora gerdemannii]|uniref:Probable 26S proteasome regulatory subunit p27 n=1 Tax=Ambispora gerdemannii TaxID=144530 RepID=A0A9N8UZP6_9GLOM|nr:514_t:CDS:2 [Ambispora gerdemannii]